MFIMLCKKTTHLYWYPHNFYNNNNNNNNVQHLYCALYTEILKFYESHTPAVCTMSAPNSNKIIMLNKFLCSSNNVLYKIINNIAVW